MANRWVRRIGIGIGSFLLVVMLAAGAIYSISAARVGKTYSVTPVALTIPTDSASIARGQHLATAIGKCVDCHGDDLGGMVLEMGPVGSFPGPNLTRGKGGRAPTTDADWIRSIRHGVGPDGRPVVFMPSAVFAQLSAPDLAALIGYLKQLPPVDRETPPMRIGPLGLMFIATQGLRWVPATALDHTAPLPAAVESGPTIEYGRYLAVVGGCTTCHGDNLRGGIKEGPPGTPPSTDLTPGGVTRDWSEADFRTALRSGMRPGGQPINPFMPWRLTRLMTDEEISAVWLYLRSLN